MVPRLTAIAALLLVTSATVLARSEVESQVAKVRAANRAAGLVALRKRKLVLLAPRTPLPAPEDPRQRFPPGSETKLDGQRFYPLADGETVGPPIAIDHPYIQLEARAARSCPPRP